MDQLVRLDNRNEGRSFFHLDVLGSTVGLTAVDGSSRQSIFYDAWGNERERLGASANNFTFTGHEKDEETGLIYAKARFYDPDIGRFLSQDSLLGQPPNPPSLHRYFYARANPLKYVDLTGREAWEEMVLLTTGDPQGKPVLPEELAFAGAVKGFGEVIISPGVFTYHLTGAWMYQRTGDEAYRYQSEIYTKAILPRMQEALSSPEAFVLSIGEGFVDQRRRFDEAMDRGDVEEASAALANFTGQFFTIVEGARTGPVIPFRGPNQFAPALAEGVATAQSSTGALTIRGAGLPGTAGILFSELFTQSGSRANAWPPR